MYVKSVRKMQKKSDKILSVRKQILEQIKQKSKNGFIWSELLLDKFKRNDIDVALHTFAKKGIIKKIINGLYWIKPRSVASIKEIGEAIMLKNNFNGVTTDENNIWLVAIQKTRKYVVGNEILTFKAISPKKISSAQSKDTLYYTYKHATDDQRNERYTPENAVNILIPYLEQLHKKLGRNITIWCPFDTEESNFVKVFREYGFNVIYSHISLGQDFFNYVPTEPVDLIASNPPFENKKKIIERLIDLNIPFSMLLPATWLNDSGPIKAFKGKQVQLLIPSKRINFQNASKKQVPFKSIFYCYNLLDRDIVYSDL